MKTKYSKTSKHLSRDEIIKLLKNQLPNNASVNALNHIKSCAFCNEAYEGIKQLPDISVLHTLNTQWKSKTAIKTKHAKLEVNLQSLYIIIILFGLIGLAIIFFFFFI